MPVVDHQVAVMERLNAKKGYGGVIMYWGREKGGGATNGIYIRSCSSASLSSSG